MAAHSVGAGAVSVGSRPSLSEVGVTMRRSDEGPGCTPGAAMEEDGMATATTTRQQALTVARQKARERRLTLDRSRDEADRKVEEATATTLIALDARDAVVAALEAAEQNVSSALRDLLARPGVTLDRAAALADLTLTELRRLMRSTAAEDTGATDAQPGSGPGSGGRSQADGPGTVAVPPVAATTEGAGASAGTRAPRAAAA